MENCDSSLSTTFRPRKSIFKKPVADQTPRLALNGQIINLSTGEHKHYDLLNQTDQHSQLKSQTCPSFYVVSTSPQNTRINANSRLLYKSTIRPQSVGGKSITFNKNTSSLFHSMCPGVNHQRIISQSPTKFSQHKIIREVRPYERVISMQQKPTIRCMVSPQITHISPVQQIHQIQPVQHIHQIQPVQQIRVIEKVQDQTIINEVNKLSSMNEMLISKYSQVSGQLQNIRQHTQQKEFVEDNIFLQKTLNKIDQIFLRETTNALARMSDLYIQKKSILKKVFKKIDMNSQVNEINHRFNVNQNNSNLSAISFHSKDNSPSKFSVFQKLKF